MKNMKKLAAGFIAAAMAMTMSLSAFADVVDPSLSKSEDKTELVINIKNDNESQMTMMAYIVEGTDWTPSNAPLYSNQEIIALDQEVGSKGFTTVPVDAAKLADGNSIVVKIGASSGTLATYVIAMQAPVVTYTVTYNLAGGTVTTPGAQTFDADDTIAAFVGALEAPAKVDLTGAYTYEFSHWSLTAEGADVTTLEGKTNMVDLLEAEATSVTLYAVYTAKPTVSDKTYILGDIDGNGVAEAKDIFVFIAYGQTGTSDYAIGQKLGSTDYVLGDIDGNGVAEAKDIFVFIAYGQTGTSDYAIGQPLN